MKTKLFDDASKGRDLSDQFAPSERLVALLPRPDCGQEAVLLLYVAK